MSTYFAYTRVSTVKQGTHGVSLQEQRSAIETYAARQGLTISAWFEEQQTAAKAGRAVFTEIIKRLRKGEAQGLIIHKIDRSARNLKDWAALGELIDAGIDVQIASESYDLSSRGGRLTADIQAVIAADYIRNLREETIKGLHGRLKQGLYPFKAPLGYLDNGSGQLKTIDPIMGPLVKRTFELYDTGHYSIRMLDKKMHDLGLRSHAGGKVGRNGISRILNEPFVHGLILIKRSGATYKGKHEPLISKALYARVQARLEGKYRAKIINHCFAFKRVFRCSECGYSLIGERQKGHVYYRCHTSKCPVTSFREERLVKAIDTAIAPLAQHRSTVEFLKMEWENQNEAGKPCPEDLSQSLTLQIANAKARQGRLLDAFIDGKIDEAQFGERNAGIDKELEQLERNLAEAGQVHAKVGQFLELALTLISSYENAPGEIRGEFLKSVTSNPAVSAKGVDIAVDLPWSVFLSEQCVPQCGLSRDRPRTFDDPDQPDVEQILAALQEHFCTNELHPVHSPIHRKP